MMFRTAIIMLFVISCGDKPEIKQNCSVDMRQSRTMFHQIHDFFSDTEYRDSAKTIVALSVLETGWFRAPVHNEMNNLFSIKDYRNHECKTKPIRCMKSFKSTDECLQHMLEYFRRNKYPSDREGFVKKLKSSGYAQDPDHAQKIVSIRKKLDNIINFGE